MKWSINHSESNPTASAVTVRSTMRSHGIRNCGRYNPNQSTAGPP